MQAVVEAAAIRPLAHTPVVGGAALEQVDWTGGGPGGPGGPGGVPQHTALQVPVWSGTETSPVGQVEADATHEEVTPPTTHCAGDTTVGSAGATGRQAPVEPAGTAAQALESVTGTWVDFFF